MNSATSRTLLLIGLAAAIGLAGCSSMSRNETTGAAVGGVTGAIVTHGSPAGAAVGAVIGGVVGHEVDKKK